MAGIKDVAAKAGVSISTVSYVVSGKRKITPQTMDRVRQAALELDYRPVLDAMRERGTRVLAVSSPVRPYTDLSNYASFFFALAGSARKYGYDLLLLMHEAGDSEMLRVSQHHMVDGIFLLDLLLGDTRTETAAALDIPVVSIGVSNETANVYSVDMDFEGMGRDAVNKAYMLGHRHVLMVCPSRSAFLDGSNFLVRFHDAAQERGEELGVALTQGFLTGKSLDDATLMLDEAFAADSQISAVFCLDSTSNVMLALNGRGARVPEDISVLAICTSGANVLCAVDEMPLLPNVVCARAMEIMMRALEGSRADMGHVELIAGEYRARGTMRPAQP